MLKLGVMKIIHGWAQRASTGLKLATVCMCVSFTSAESCANLQYIMLSLRSHRSRDVLDQLLLALATSIGSVWEGSTQLLLILQDKGSNTIGGWLTPLFFGLCTVRLLPRAHARKG